MPKNSINNFEKDWNFVCIETIVSKNKPQKYTLLDKMMDTLVLRYIF